MPPRHCEMNTGPGHVTKLDGNQVQRHRFLLNPSGVLQASLPPVHVLYKFSYQHGSQKEDRFQIRDESGRTSSAVLVQIKGNCHITKLGKKKMKEKKAAFRQHYCSKNRKEIQEMWNVMTRSELS